MIVSQRGLSEADVRNSNDQEKKSHVENELKLMEY